MRWFPSTPPQQLYDSPSFYSLQFISNEINSFYFAIHTGVEHINSFRIDSWKGRSSDICYNIQTCFSIIFYNRTKNMPKNITNGQFVIAYDQNDRVDSSFKFMRCPNNQSLQFLKHQPQKTVNNYYIQNIRTGQFTQISENYMLQSTKEKQDQQRFTTNSFQTEMHNLFQGLQEKMNRLTTWFQGLFSGMALLYTITLNLSTSVSPDLVRVQDQALRVVAILSSFGAMYSFLIAQQKYNHIKTRGTSSQVDRHYKSFMLCLIEMIFYTISYVIYNVSHTYAVQYNISSLTSGATVVGYTQLSQITTVYTVFAMIGWIFTNVNTYKYEI